MVNNFRPVSLTSVVCKIMERILSDYPRKIWEEKRLIHSSQRGFRKGYLCESQLISVCQYISNKFDSGSRIYAIITDFAKAFDVIPHDLLFLDTKQNGNGYSGTAVDSGISGRTQS